VYILLHVLKTACMCLFADVVHNYLWQVGLTVWSPRSFVIKVHITTFFVFRFDSCQASLLMLSALLIRTMSGTHWKKSS